MCDDEAPGTMRRIAFVVSHPIQYYAPIYQRLAARSDLEVKVFFTWHDGRAPVVDVGFRQAVAWDIPLTTGYAFETVNNVSPRPGTNNFFGIRCPDLLGKVLSWRPDAVHVTGWAWAAHLKLLRDLARERIPVVFRGDSHLLDGKLSGPRWLAKRMVLRRVYSWPSAFLYTGAANKAYYSTFGVPQRKLFGCPHTIDVGRFVGVADEYERQARQWRKELGIGEDQPVALFAGKFEPKKRPLDLMRAILRTKRKDLVLVLVGDGELNRKVHEVARSHPSRFRVLPFQNQTRMPVVYRLGDFLVLPSAWSETWGLAVNEALACGRPVLVSDRVGCAVDVLVPHADEAPRCGDIFPWDDETALIAGIQKWSVKARDAGARAFAVSRAKDFDTRVGEERLLECLRATL